MTNFQMLALTFSLNQTQPKKKEKAAKTPTVTQREQRTKNAQFQLINPIMAVKKHFQHGKLAPKKQMVSNLTNINKCNKLCQLTSNRKR